ncbi:MAG: hypothetical protein H6Q71_927 [Firmicutes bacterium]|nr:hypothetical protein [Bacillota bacterium]
MILFGLKTVFFVDVASEFFERFFSIFREFFAGVLGEDVLGDIFDVSWGLRPYKVSMITPNTSAR